MHPTLRTTLALAAAGTAAPGMAGSLTVSVEIPRLSVAEYHRPYVAVWLERPDQAFVGNLAVWYDLKKQNQEGAKWLKDLRTWWRRSGRELDLPIDGLSSATRPPGAYPLTFSDAKAPLQSLPAGTYHVVVEAAREVGGRELVRVPIQWPPAAASRTQVRGEHELGAIGVELRP